MANLRSLWGAWKRLRRCLKEWLWTSLSSIARIALGHLAGSVAFHLVAQFYYWV